MISSGRPKVSRFGVTKAATPSLEHPRRLANDPIRIGHVLHRVTRDHRAEAGVRERQLAHVGDHRLSVLVDEDLRVDVHADRLTRSQPIVAVTRAAAQIQHRARAKEGLAENIRRGVALPGRVHPARRGDRALAGDLHGMNFGDHASRAR